MLVNEADVEWTETEHGDTAFRRKQLGSAAGGQELGCSLYDLRAGDYAALPADKSGAHQVANDGDEPLRYLVFSTMNEPDVTAYPETDKVGVFVGAAPGGDADERPIHAYFRREDAVDYWE